MEPIKILCGGLIVLCVAAMVPPKPKTSRQSAAIHQGAGALTLITRSIALPPAGTKSFAWQYPPGVNPSNYWWNIEVSADLKNWSVLVSNASGIFEEPAIKNNPLRVYRLSGRLEP